MELKVELTPSATRATASGRNVGVGGDEAEHRRHVRLNHSRAFRAAEEADFFAPDAELAAAHFGRVSVVMMARANSSNAPASAFRRANELRHRSDDFLDAQRRANHAGGANEKLRRIAAAQFLREPRGGGD